MNRWVLVALLCGVISWINSLLVVGKLRADGYKYSDLYSSKIYKQYWQAASDRGWSRVPVLVIPVSLVLSALAFFVGVLFR